MKQPYIKPEICVFSYDENTLYVTLSGDNFPGNGGHNGWNNPHNPHYPGKPKNSEQMFEEQTFKSNPFE